MIVGVSSVKDEAEIIGQTVSHLKGEGVDQLIISVGGDPDDETWRAIRKADPGSIVLTQVGDFDQGREITMLAQMALEYGATWVIPFDADEFWIDPLGGSIKSVLDAQPPGIGLIHCAAFTHLDWDRKVSAQKHFGKVAFRPTPGTVVQWGNHTVSGVSGAETHGLLEVRELQYRSWDHLVAKVAKAQALFDSWEVPWVFGGHMRALCARDEEGLRQFWADFQALEAEIDPIPYRGV